jgi:hypothetical protein
LTFAWARSSPTHICGWALAVRAVVPVSVAYPAATRYAVRDAEVVAVPAATESAESGAGLGVSVGVGDPVPVGDPVSVGVGELVSVGGGVVDPVLGGGVVDPVLGGGVDDPVLGGGVVDPVLGGGMDDPVPGDFVGGLDECCDGVARAGRFSTLHCRFVAGVAG